MHILPTRVHGFVDYLWGILLIVSPFALGFANDPSARWIAWIFGAGALIYSALTVYELGAVKVIPMPAHLGLDALAGGILALLPLVTSVPGPAAWVFGVFGTFAVVAAFVTEPRPGTFGHIGA